MEQERIERLQTFIDEGRIVRHAWLGTDAQGRETACLLAALSPEAGEAEDAEACPASVMPAWMAHLTPWIDEASDTEWPQVIRRYAACAARWSALDDAAWRRVEAAARRASVVEAMRHTTDERVLDACRGVLVWLDDDMPESSQAAAWGAAWASAREAAWEAEAAWAALDAAAWAAEAAAWAARDAAALAAEAAGAAAWEAAWEAAAVAATMEAVLGAKAAAADRIIDAVLSALERECGI